MTGKKNRLISHSEAGSILLLVEIFLIIIMIFAGLAIDGSMVATSKAQHHHTAEDVALAALRSYMFTSGNWDNKLEAARESAEQIAGINFFISSPLQENPDQPQDLGMNVSPKVTGENGQIVPGKWLFKEPQDFDCAAFPACCENDNWKGPCFQKATEADLRNLEYAVNAFQVELHLRENSPIRTIFARVHGAETLTIASKATATLIPRHGVFLVDLSRSAHRTTHLPFETLTGADIKNACESAFKLTQPCPDPADPNLCLPPNVCRIEGGGRLTFTMLCGTEFLLQLSVLQYLATIQGSITKMIMSASQCDMKTRKMALKSMCPI